MRDPLDPPTYDPREDDFDADDIASADSFEGLATISGEFQGFSYDTEPDTMILRLRVSVGDAKSALSFRGGRGILTLEKPR